MIDLGHKLGAEFPSDIPLEHTIADMTIGEKGFTLPWGMMIDECMRCYLCETYPCYPERQGTVRMPIERRDDGYYVWVEGLDERWKPSRGIPWMGATEDNLIPVRGFIRGE